MLYAGQELADHLVGATRNKAWIDTAAVFGTETLAFRGGGAARHGARLVLLPAVSDAMLRSLSWTGGAAIKLASSNGAMLGADATCSSKSGAAFHLAHFCAATTMPTAPSFCY